MSKTSLWFRFQLYLVVFFASLFSIKSTAIDSNEKIIGFKFLTYIDQKGNPHCEEYYFVENQLTGEITARKPGEIQTHPSSISPTAAKEHDEGLFPHFFRRLPKGTTEIKIGFNTHANARREDFENIVRDYLNPHRGAAVRPLITLTDEVTYTDDIDGWDLHFDGRSMIYCHPDDHTYAEMFRGSYAAAASVHCDFAKGILYEVNVSYTYAFLFSNDRGRYESWFGTTIHEFGHVFGYRHIGLVEDFMSYRRPYDYALFSNPDGVLWRNSKLKDKMTYGGKLKDGIYKAKPKLLPTDYNHIDIKYLKTVGANLNIMGHVIAMTTLKAYRKKPLELAVYRGKKVKDKKLLLKIDGINREIYKTEGLLEKYEVSEIVFSREEDYLKLEAAVKQYGKPKAVFWRDYKYAMLATITVTGYKDPEAEKPKTLKRTVWFVLEE